MWKWKYCSIEIWNAGDDESKNLLDAFFLGKALAETLNERIESAVGEVLSTMGRLQAEQQKQVQEFQVSNHLCIYFIVTSVVFREEMVEMAFEN